MAVEHSTLTGSSLHEPKGVENATANYVYAADGAGSGTWSDMNTLVTATNFTTGDLKATIKTTADSGWVMLDDGTLGDALSGGSTRANSDCENLFTLLWNNISNTYAAVSSGRGANAAADWAAHKTIALPKALGRVLGASGAGSGLTSRSLGQTLGEENHTMSTSEMVSHAHAGTTNTEGQNHTHAVSGTTGTESTTHTHDVLDSGTGSQPVDTLEFSGSAAAVSGTTRTTGGQSVSHTHSFSLNSGTQSVGHTHTFTTGTSGSTTPFNVMQPTMFVNYMIKL